MHDSPAEPLQHVIIAYGIKLLARQLGQTVEHDEAFRSYLHCDDEVATAALAWARYQIDDTVPLNVPLATPASLRSIFSLLAFDDERRRQPERVDVPLRRLDLDLKNRASQSAQEIWQQFMADVRRLPSGPGQLETFTALMVRYGASVAGSLESTGIAVAEQFRIVAALATILPPKSDQLLLVEGDLSGIQEMLYTITSRGAAKNLRGRSFYVQLLADALSRALLYGLALPTVCLIFNAGGHFRLLARATDDQRLAALRHDLNHRLLLLHGGDLALALAWTSLSADDLARDTFGDRARVVAEGLDGQKARAFAGLVALEPQRVAGVIDSGCDRFCVICHAELPPLDQADASEDAAPLRCDQCASFGERTSTNGHGLARQLANCIERPFMAVRVNALPPLPDPTTWQGRPAWDVALQSLGVQYRFAQEARAGAGVTLYRLNDPDFLPPELVPGCAYNFRFLAFSTPRIATNETRWLQAFVDRGMERDATELLAFDDDQRERLEANAIRPLLLMANWDSTGVNRYGVLRMDLDGLGTLFHRRLMTRSLLHMSALSHALSRFFEGWLNTICTEVAVAWQAQAAMVTNQARWRMRMAEVTGMPIADETALWSKTPYVIYAGGDDLFVVGPWDVLPVLAARIRHDLASLALRGVVDATPLDATAPITVSAGITAESALFPLYQAAEQAGAALKTAKRRRRQTEAGESETIKDAICLLGMTVSWEELAQAERLAYELARLIDVGVQVNGQRQPNTAPHALIQLLMTVAQQYDAVAHDDEDGLPVYGRWMPLLAYGLRRMADRVPAYNDDLRRQILGLAGETLDLTRVAGAANWTTMRFLALPVRWAQLLIRTGG